MPDEDTPDEGGLEPAAVETPDAGGDAPVEAPPAPTFGVEDIATGLGSRFQERFLAHHEPAQAISEYGKSVEHLQSAYSRLSQGGAPTAEDYAHAEALGVELPQPVEEEPEAVEPLWGAPWAEPTTMDEFYAMANARPDQAMAFIDANPGRVNDETRMQVLNYWAEHDRAAAISYEREQARSQAINEAKAYADEQLAAMRAEFAPVHQGHITATNETRAAKLSNLATLANANVPDFAEHQAGVTDMIQRYASQYGIEYFDNLLALPLDKQLEHITELTGAVAWRGRPAAEAQAAAEVAAADAAKVAAGSERGRGAANGGSGAMSEMKKKNLADFKALQGVDVN